MRAPGIAAGLVAAGLVAAGLVALACPAPGTPCVSSAECTQREVCAEGICRRVCNVTGDCAAGGRCVEGICQERWDGAEPEAGGADRSAPLDAGAQEVVPGDRGLDGSLTHDTKASADAVELDRAAIDHADTSQPDVSSPLPVVVTILPTDGTTSIAPSTTVRLSFDTPMEPYSVESRFHLHIDDSDLPGTFSWEASDTMAFVPADPLLCDVTYLALLEPGARAETGALTTAELAAEFTTRASHEVCDQCPDHCADVNTDDYCGGCVAEVESPCINVGTTYCVACGGPCEVTDGCWYQRRQYFVDCNCHAVCD